MLWDYLMGNVNLTDPLMSVECLSERLWRHAAALPQTHNRVFGMSCPTVSLTPRRGWLHPEPDLILVLTAAGKADARSVVNTSEITSLA